ncbi:Rho1 guanine nucleotide exchange factor 3 [Escovopsis weberi]|uniref:Rho1 guanine nucleotide exchange factor 3 n=1 Tax=Escovopsis weberi TaxID=150374 RepID=A0A0M8N6B0_ESCWE|nr:Rho1 guanine nucleotide exchange factor 3 [Escovopsis weberi]
MSFRGEDRSRYGHVPPVQYPIPGHSYQQLQLQQQQQQQQQQQAQQQQQPPPPSDPRQHLTRQPSFNSGDDGAAYGRAQAYGESQFANNDELFMNTTPASNYPTGRPASTSVSSVRSSFGQQYQDQLQLSSGHSTYNPQSFAQSSSDFRRSQSQSLPYHPAPPSGYSGNLSNAYANPTSPIAGYAPQAYNPAAYANTSPQRQPTYHGYTNSQSSVYSNPYGSPAYQQQSPVAPQYVNMPLHPEPSPRRSYGYEQHPMPPVPSSSTVTRSRSSAPAYNAPQHAHRPAYPSDKGAPSPAPFNTSSQAPYPTTSSIPVGPAYSPHDDVTMYNRHTRSDSQSSLASPYAHQVGSSGVQRHPTNAPLPSRPMAELPEEEAMWSRNGRPLPDPAVQSSYDEVDDHYHEDSIVQEIEAFEAEIGGAGPRIHRRPLPVPSELGGSGDHNALVYAGGCHDPDTDHRTSFYENERGAGHDDDDDDNNNNEDDDDDPEGTAGVLAMQQAELEDQRFGGSSFMYTETAPLHPLPPISQQHAPNPLPPPPAHKEDDQSSDSDFGGDMDLGGLSGGYVGNLAYGTEVGYYGSVSGMDYLSRSGSRPLPVPSHRNEAYEYNTAFNNAEVDYGGTGGFQEIRRLSFDRGEDRVSLHSQQSGGNSPTKDDYGDLFFHPGLTNRPLPEIPSNTGPLSDSSSSASGQATTRTDHPQNAGSRLSYEHPGQYYNNALTHNQHPERSISLAGFNTAPQVHTPARSQTDAAPNERRKMARQHQQAAAVPITNFDNGMAPPAGGFDTITLPTGRKRKFVPSKLTSVDFKRCPEPWALSGIETWIREMTEGELDLRQKIVEEALTILFTIKVPTMNVADAEALSTCVVELMLANGVLLHDEEWVKYGEGHISGVFWQLTGSGCYAPKLHDQEINGRCYSSHCTRTLRKVDLEALNEGYKPADEWHIFYDLKKEDIMSRPKKEVERQNILHEIVTGEEKYIKQLDIFRTLYRDELRVSQPPIIHPDRRDKFLGTVFGKLDTVLRINKDHLLAQLKYRQQEQGPWIVGFSDLFREWIRKAKSEYIEYATTYPRAAFMIRKEASRNILFKKFLEDKQRHKSSSKQDWTHFLITPLQRLQRYILLLETVDRKMPGESEEKTNLNRAIEEIRTVTLECDAKVAETNRRVEMMELDRMLVLRPGFQSVLNLEQPGRTIIIQGDLQRLSSKGMKWVDTHALLFDHYLILAKVPIPMPLLFLETMNEEPVIKQKGITAPLAGRTATATGAQLSKVTINGIARPGTELSPTNTALSAQAPLAPAPAQDAEGKILYPFKVKHLGHEIYTLYASSARDRQDWCAKIVEAKTRHAKALFQQNAEPFRLRVLADASFHYDNSSPYARTAGVPVKGTPLDRAIQELEEVLGPAQGVAPVCRAQVNCATGFSAFGKQIIAVGTDYGVYITDPSSPRGWSRSIQAPRITQLAVLEEFSIAIVITDKSLISYPLDVLAPLSEFAAPANDSPRRAPQRLAKDVTYFAIARMKDRTLLFYKRKEGLHTTFKVLEPILHKATEKRARFFGGRRGGAGNTESFRDFDEFFFPIECFSLSLFQTYIAVSTARGIEMLTLDKKHPISIPDLKAAAIANIASRIRDQRPLGMFRLNENEFILTYEDCAVYVDKHGEVSRTLIMEYTGKQKKAKGATMYGQYLILYNEDYVEVRNADNGRLRQIIAGRDVRLIDLGIRGPTNDNALQAAQVHGHNGHLVNAGDASKGTVKIAMCHPELPGRQVILEMLLNDGHSEA